MSMEDDAASDVTATASVSDSESWVMVAFFAAMAADNSSAVARVTDSFFTLWVVGLTL